MTTTERLWMTRQAHVRLREELADLRSRPRIEVPDDFMDNGESIAKYAARQIAHTPDRRPAAPMPSSMRIHPTMESPNPEWS